MKIIIAFVFVISSLSNLRGQQIYYTIGPMFHFNIGGKQMKTSFGMEFSYWNYNHFPYSVDFGFDFQKSKFRLYSEMQTGIVALGLSSGPYMELRKNAPVNFGLQGSLWANCILGMDMRFRITKGQDYFAPGVYTKYIWDNNGSNGSTSGSTSGSGSSHYSHHHHHHHH